MDLKNNQITVKEILANPKARSLFQREFPMVMNPRFLHMIQNTSLQVVLEFGKAHVPQAKINRILAELKSL